MWLGYPPLDLVISTPRLRLAGATDSLLERLVPVVREGLVGAGPLPFDDPMSLYEDSPERGWRWLRGIWAGRARVDREFWRLYFVVMLDDAPVGTVGTFSWLQGSWRHRGIGKEMRSAILHLAFAGLGAKEARSEAFTDNGASNGVSRALGYEPNGTNWATRRGSAAPLSNWRLTRERWERNKRDDIELLGVAACLPALGL